MLVFEWVIWATCVWMGTCTSILGRCLAVVVLARGWVFLDGVTEGKGGRQDTAAGKMLSLGRNRCCRRAVGGPRTLGRLMVLIQPNLKHPSYSRPRHLPAGSMELSETLQLQVCGSLCNVPNGCYWLEESLGMQPAMACRTTSSLASEEGEGRLLEWPPQNAAGREKVMVPRLDLEV